MPQDISANDRLVLTGEVTLQAADTVHAQLLAMSNRPTVEIDCGGLTEADLSLIQVILAARISAKQSGRSIRLTQPLPDAMLKTLQRGGFLAASGEPPKSNQAFWLQTADMQ